MNGLHSFDDIVQPRQLQDRFASVADRSLRWNLVQLQAALRLVAHFFGSEWYKVAIGGFNDPDTMASRTYHRLVRSEQPHPLGEALWSGEPQEYVRFLGLGAALRVLGCERETSLEAKLAELRSAEFAKAYFELKIAALYALDGFEVKFLRPRKAVKTPDFSVSKYGLRTVVECKKRNTASDAPLQTRVGGVLDRLRDAHTQIAASSNYGVICIEVEDDLDFNSEAVKAYVNAVQSELPLLQAVTCVMITWETILHMQEEALSLSTAARGIPNTNLYSQRFSPIPAEALCNPNVLGALDLGYVIPGLENGPAIEIDRTD